MSGLFLRLATLLVLLVMLLGSLFTAGTFAATRGYGLGVAGQMRSAREPVTARAAISQDPVIPGEKAYIAVEIAVDPRYHIQSAVTSANNIPTKIEPKPVAGIAFGRPRYPVSHNVPPPGGLPNEPPIPVYSGIVYIMLPVEVETTAPLGAATIDLSLTAQACDDKSCLPPKTLTLHVPITIAAAGAAQTQPAPALIAAASGQPYAPDSPADAAASTTTSGATSFAGPGQGSGVNAQASAIKLLSTDDQLAMISARPYKAHNSSEQEYPFVLIILLALCGGVILNIMPCVLPVIPLKVLSLVQQAHGDRRLAVMHALAFSAGVISLFTALALVLKTFGLFYGQQFQSPAFLITMALLVVALALSMLGVWTINPPRAVYSVDTSHSGYLGAYSNGLIATLLATPCSAPYLGPVFAWAFVQPTGITAAALALVGVGMSLPYLILAAFPALLNRLPKAGRWAELLKQGLGIVMIGVAVYLIALVPNVVTSPWIVEGGVLVALVCWGWGQIPTLSMGLGKIWLIRTLVVLVGLVLGAGLYFIAERTAHPSTETWQPFNVALLDEALREGRPVVVDWTADWCINCRALEAAVLSRQAVQKQFTDSNAVLLRADLSSDNPPASALNQKLGGESIPVLAIFAPSHPFEPTVLRDSYSQARVISEVANAQR